MTFVVWGLLHGLFLMLESYKIIPLEKLKFKPIKHIYTMLVVCVTFVIFRADTLNQAWIFIGKMFTGFNITAESHAAFLQQIDPLFITVLILGILFAMPITKVIQRSTENSKTEVILNVGSYAFSFVMLALCIISLASSTFNPFIYLQF